MGLVHQWTVDVSGWWHRSDNDFHIYNHEHVNLNYQYNEYIDKHFFLYLHKYQHHYDHFYHDNDNHNAV